MDYSLPGSSVHGILQARILEWVAMPSSRASSQPRDWTHVSYISCIGRWILYHLCLLGSPSLSPYFSFNPLFYHPNCLHCFHSPTPHCIHRNFSKTKKSFFGSHNVWDQDNLFHSQKKTQVIILTDPVWNHSFKNHLNTGPLQSVLLLAFFQCCFFQYILLSLSPLPDTRLIPTLPSKINTFFCLLQKALLC